MCCKDALDWCCNCEGGIIGFKYVVRFCFTKEVKKKLIIFEELKYKLKINICDIYKIILLIRLFFFG